LFINLTLFPISLSNNFQQISLQQFQNKRKFANTRRNHSSPPGTTTKLLNTGNQSLTEFRLKGFNHALFIQF